MDFLEVSQPIYDVLGVEVAFLLGDVSQPLDDIGFVLQVLNFISQLCVLFFEHWCNRLLDLQLERKDLKFSFHIDDCLLSRDIGPDSELAMLLDTGNQTVVEVKSGSIVQRIFSFQHRRLQCQGRLIHLPLLMQKLALSYHTSCEFSVLDKFFHNSAMLLRQLVYNKVGFVFNELCCFFEYNRFQVFQLLLKIRLYLFHLFVAEALVFLVCGGVLDLCQRSIANLSTHTSQTSMSSMSHDSADSRNRAPELRRLTYACFHQSINF